MLRSSRAIGSISAIVLSLSLIGCGGSVAVVSPSPSETPTTVPSPTPMPSPTPTPSPTPPPIPRLATNGGCTILWNAATEWHTEFSDWLSYEGLLWSSYVDATATYYSTFTEVYASIKGGDKKEVAALKKYLGIVRNLNTAAENENTYNTASVALDWSDYGTTFTEKYCFGRGWKP